MRIPKLNLLAGAMAVLLAAVAPALAVTPLFGGGTVLAERVYRDIFNCYGNRAGGDTLVGLTGFAARCNTAPVYNANVEPLYVGSGNGKKSFVNRDASHFTDGPRTPDAVPVPSTADFGPFYGTGRGVSWIPGSTDTGPFFLAVSFVSSEEPLSAGDIAAYGGISGGHWGTPIQVPAFITTIAVAFHKTSVWTAKGVDVGGASSNVNLTTDTLCGIFTGAITNWNDAAFKSANGGVQLGSGPITVIYRRDNSGGTFLLTNALIRQCARTTHPVPLSWQSAAGNSSGAGNDLFFVNVAGAGLLPANFSFVPNGQTVQTAIAGIVGSIGYDSPDTVQFVNLAGAPAANLQSFASIGATPLFVSPTAQNTASILGPIKPPSSKPISCPPGTAFGQSPDGVCSHNVLNWGLTFPAPLLARAYPIGGFSYIDLYTCYASTAARDGLAGTTAGSLGLLRWFFGSATDNSGQVKTELNRNGFSVLPGSWVGAVKKLLTTDPKTKIGIPGQIKTGCATVSGGA